jgi:hypothetical protein
VTEEMVRSLILRAGPRAAPADAAGIFRTGYDELYVQQSGQRQEEFFALLERELLPRF